MLVILIDKFPYTRKEIIDSGIVYSFTKDNYCEKMLPRTKRNYCICTGLLSIITCIQFSIIILITNFGCKEKGYYIACMDNLVAHNQNEFYSALKVECSYSRIFIFRESNYF